MNGRMAVLVVFDMEACLTRRNPYYNLASSEVSKRLQSKLNRRAFLATCATVAAAQTPAVPDAIRNLKPMTDGVQPITDAERAARVEKARRLMRQNRLAAIALPSGTSMYYFTGKRQPGQSWILPGRRASRCGRPPNPLQSRMPARHGSRDGQRRGSKSRSASPWSMGFARKRRRSNAVSATPVTAGCRMIKSPAEIALMQRANDITIAAYKAGTRHPARGHDAGRTERQHRRRVPRARRAGGARRPSSASTPRFRTAASRRRS